jgi:hypothetical protein
MSADDASMPFPPGTIVEVRNRFDGSWCPEFEVDRAGPEGYTLRRCRDGAVLPNRFASALVRPADESV